MTILPNRDGPVMMRHIDEGVRFCKARGAGAFLGSYLPPWEPHPTSEGEIQYEECSVRLDPSIVQNCTVNGAEQLDRLPEMFRDRGTQSFEASQIEEV